MTPKIVIDDVDRYALQAMAAGVASSGQQRRALNFIVNLSGLRDVPQVHKTDGEQYFREGMRFVGYQVARLTELVGVTTEPKPKG